MIKNASNKKVAILQSSYIPWKGYFDLIRKVDEFIIFDDVQFTKRDWRNRNLIKSPQGLLWLTIPVTSKSRYVQKISETEIADPSWAEAHWNSIRHSYAKAPCFIALAPALQKLLEEAARERELSKVNYRILKEVCGLLNISTPLTWSSDYPAEGHKTDRLLALCEAAGARHYLSGPAAKAYLEEDKFAKANISVEYMNYDTYVEYPQLHGAFEPKVSIIDSLLMLGKETGATIFERTSHG